jgi:dienelactone hydrolase
MKRSACLAFPLLALAAAAWAAADPGSADPSRVLPTGQKPDDARLGPPRTLNDKDFFFHVPPTRDAWEARRTALREQILVAEGLWPMPEKTPLNPVIHGKIDRDDYTIEKVFFASMPGHYVSGNLYRPKGKTGKLPAVLFPHGHWEDARFFDAGEKTAADIVKGGGEKTTEGARYPLQALPAQLARMGCVVFHYDMVGHSDSKAIEHKKGFKDADAELRLQSFMGLQTWNSIRALDFVASLPDVDATRIGVTGASGGGTQTFILCAIDDRPAAAFPAVMMSTQMQGGCVCENCSLLRQGTGNVEIAGLFAPKPLGMTGADDWTIDIEKKGLPELKQLYKLYDSEDKVMAKCFPQFKHQYNQTSREVMYNWFNKHLKLEQPEPVVEKPFTPVVPTKDLSVYDADHPLPKDAASAEKLRQTMTEASDKQIAALLPKDAKSLAEYRRVTGTALRVMVHDELPKPEDVEFKQVGDREEHDGVILRRYLIGRKGAGEQIPAIGMCRADFDGTVVVWVHPAGKASLYKDGKLVPAAQKILDAKKGIFAPDVFGTGELTPEKPPAVNDEYAGFTFGYNRPPLAQRVHDILSAVAYVRGHEKTKQIDLVGWEKAGPWVLLARPLCGDAVARTAADGDEFRFEKVRTVTDDMLLPGALKYGGLYALAATAAPAELYVHNHHGTGSGHWLKAAYEAAGAMDKLQRLSEKAADDKVVEWLLR